MDDHNGTTNIGTSWPRKREFERILISLSPFERILFATLCVAFVVSALFVVEKLNRALLTEVPARGGELIEGVMGSPRFINPLLAISDVDRDLVSLIYSGLMKATPEGELVPDLAERYEISGDGLVYTFFLRDDAEFHDGASVTADDVVFTVTQAQHPALKSPKRANWEGVIATKINDHEVALTLKQPYAPFLENTTMGILPVHIWKDIDADAFPFSTVNIEAIGSGPYRIDRIRKNDNGILVAYDLIPFKQYPLGRPYIENLQLRFYGNEDALITSLNEEVIESASGISPGKLSRITRQDVNIEQTPLPRVFAVFFNQNQAGVFAKSEVRKALDAALNKKLIVTTVLSGYGTVIDSPLPPGILTASSTQIVAAEDRLAGAQQILLDAGWKRGDDGVFIKGTGATAVRLSFSLATSNVPELAAAAQLVETQWEALGAEVDLKVFEPSALNQTSIRPRKYDALFFGEIVGRELDLFAFWHSSQRNDPGLNIALYANITADKLLEEARTLEDRGARLEKFKEFEEEIKKDIPAVFLYAPDFIYVVPKKLKGLSINGVTMPSDRFLGVREWHVVTEKVWPFFTWFE